MSTQDHEEMTAKPRLGRRARALLLAIGGFLLLGAAWEAYYLAVGRYQVSTDDAYVHGDRVIISPQVAGTVISVDVRDTDFVARGQTLMRLDTANAQVALSQAEARLAAAVRQVHEAFDQVHALQATVAMDQAQLTLAADNAKRQERLLRRGMTSAERAQQAQTLMQVAAQKIMLDEARLAGARAMVTGTSLSDNPLVLEAASLVRKDYLEVARARIVSPVSGYIANSAVQLGQQVKPGSELMNVVPLSRVWVDANFKESDLSHVRIGQPVRLISDFYGSHVVYRGHVMGLMPGTGAVFALLPAQNATGNWIKVVQRIPVRISLPADELKRHPLRLGLSMRVTIDIRNRHGSGLAAMPHAARKESTQVYAHQLDGADSLVKRIIRENSGSRLDAHE